MIEGGSMGLLTTFVSELVAPFITLVAFMVSMALLLS